MTVYGNTDRVSVDISGGGIHAVTGGSENKVVVFARGDPNSGSASVNDPTRVDGGSELESTFGSDTPIVEYMRQLAANGISYDLMYGVMPEQKQVQDEDITGGGDAQDHTGGSKIANVPLVEDTSLITVEDDGGNAIEVEFKYETNTDGSNSDFTGNAPTDADTMFINRAQGEWIADEADNYDITYEYLDWQPAFDAAVDVVGEQEIGGWAVGDDVEEVVNKAQATATPLRENQWKMVHVFGISEANKTSDSGTAHLNVSDYTDALDNDFTFLFGPGRQAGSKLTVIGGIAGIAISNDIDNPIIGESVSGTDKLDQTLNVPDQEDLEDEQVASLSNIGAPTIESNTATSTATDWNRTYFARYLADYLALAARALAKAARGEINNDNTADLVEEQLSDEIIELIDDGVLEPNDPDTDEDSWFVNAYEDENDPNKLNVEYGFTPEGVVDIVDVDATINY